MRLIKRGDRTLISRSRSTILNLSAQFAKNIQENIFFPFLFYQSCIASYPQFTHKHTDVASLPSPPLVKGNVLLQIALDEKINVQCFRFSPWRNMINVLGSHHGGIWFSVLGSHHGGIWFNVLGSHHGGINVQCFRFSPWRNMFNVLGSHHGGIWFLTRVRAQWRRQFRVINYYQNNFSSFRERKFQTVIWPTPGTKCQVWTKWAKSLRVRFGLNEQSHWVSGLD